MSINVSISEQTMIYHNRVLCTNIVYIVRSMIKPSCIGLVIMPNLFKKQSQCITCDSTYRKFSEWWNYIHKMFDSCSGVRKGVTIKRSSIGSFLFMSVSYNSSISWWWWWLLKNQHMWKEYSYTTPKKKKKLGPLKNGWN